MNKIEELIECIEKTSYYFYVYRENMGIEKYKEISFLLPEIFLMNNVDLNGILYTLECCNNQLANSNYIQLADHLEYELLPLIKNIYFDGKVQVHE